MSAKLCGYRLSRAGVVLLCVLERGHDGDHWCGGVSYPNPMESEQQNASLPAPAASFEELISHLDDLIALAYFEGFALIGAELARLGTRIAEHALIFNPSPAVRAADAAAFASLEEAKGRR